MRREVAVDLSETFEEGYDWIQHPCVVQRDECARLDCNPIGAT